MPLDAWILLFVSVGLGLGLEIAFFRARRGDAQGLTAPATDLAASADSAAPPTDSSR